MFLGMVARGLPSNLVQDWFRHRGRAILRCLTWIKSVAAAHAALTGSPAKFIMPQDSAPAHRAARTLAFLAEEQVDIWSPNSPDLNPLDYSVWSMISQEACRNRPKSVATMYACMFRGRPSWRCP